MTGELIALSSARGRWVLVVTIMGSAVALLEATIVNVALPAIGADLGADVAGLQWILNGYLLTLAALILLAGSLGDRFGRRRMYVIGVAWFTLASAACAFAPTVEVLVAGRVLQGVGGALLTPGSLAILEASLRPEDRGRAIGLWSGLTGVGAAIGPVLGGWLVDAASWRWVFLVNLPLGVAVVLLALRHVPESRDTEAAPGFDVAGALLATLGLAAATFGLVSAGERGFGDPLVLATLVAGVAGLAAFVRQQFRSRHPMLPPGVFADRQFAAANLVTFAVYAALGGVFFLLVITLQVAVGYSAVAAGAAGLPITALLLLLSGRAGAMTQRIGPRKPLTAGPILLAAGMLLMRRIDPGAEYLTDVLPAVLVFGLGLATVVAPVTATVLAAAEDRYAGVASGVNNAVARTAQLLAVAALPLIAGIDAAAYADPQALADAFGTAMLVTAGLALVGAALAWTQIRDDVLH